MNITKLTSPNRNTGRQGNTPDFIVCHITDGAFDGAVSWAMNAEAQVSYHFLVARDGRVTQVVDIADTAWGNGTTNSGDNRDNRNSKIAAVRERRLNANLYTVSIGFEGRWNETRGELTAVQLSTGVELIKHIRSEVKRIYGFEIPMKRTNIIGHFEVTPITKPNCPGERFPWDELIRLLNPVVVPPPVTPPAAGVADWAKEAWAWAVANGITDGTRPADNATRQEVVTLLHRVLGKVK